MAAKAGTEWGSGPFISKLSEVKPLSLVYPFQSVASESLNLPLAAEHLLQGIWRDGNRGLEVSSDRMLVEQVQGPGFK